MIEKCGLYMLILLKTDICNVFEIWFDSITSFSFIHLLLWRKERGSKSVSPMCSYMLLYAPICPADFNGVLESPFFEVKKSLQLLYSICLVIISNSVFKSSIWNDIVVRKCNGFMRICILHVQVNIDKITIHLILLIWIRIMLFL